MNMYLKIKNLFVTVSYANEHGLRTYVPARVKPMWWYKVRYTILKFKHLNFGCKKWSSNTYQEIKHFLEHGNADFELWNFTEESCVYESIHHENVDEVDDFIAHWLEEEFSYLID